MSTETGLGLMLVLRILLSLLFCYYLVRAIMDVQALRKYLRFRPWAQLATGKIWVGVALIGSTVFATFSLWWFPAQITARIWVNQAVALSFGVVAVIGQWKIAHAFHELLEGRIEGRIETDKKEADQGKKTRKLLERLIILTDRLTIKVDAGSATSARIEKSGVEVAMDLAAAHKRADDTHGKAPAGTAADAAAQQTTKEKISNET